MGEQDALAKGAQYMKVQDFSENVRIDWDVPTIPGWREVHHIWDEWDEIANEEFEVSSSYSALDGCIACVLKSDYFD